MLATFALLATLGAPPASLPFIADDYPGAERRALAEKKLIAVDVWATWCHSCLSMKNFVLKDPELAKLADTHVWLALDYDQEKNAAFFQSYPIDVFPTFLVVDPAAKKVVSRWAGSGSVEEMLRFFAEAGQESDSPLQAGRRAMALRKYEEAEALFLSALASEKSPERRTEILSAALESTSRSDPERCLALGREHLDRVSNTAPGMDFVAMFAGCVAGLDDAERRKALWTSIRDRLLAAQKAGLGRLSPDDRSTVYDTLTSAHRALGDAKAATKVVEAHLRDLEGAAKKSKTAEARATFDAYRLACYLELKRYAEAEKMLTASEKALPNDFNPPWRLAVLHHAQGKSDAGLAAIERALTKGYGPRRARLHTTKIDLLLQKQDYAAALAAIEAARQDLARLDPALIRKAWTEQLAAREQEARAKLGS